jgi:hypothetical protein
VYAAWHRETPVAVKRTACLMEVEMNLHAGGCAALGLVQHCMDEASLPLPS